MTLWCLNTSAQSSWHFEFAILRSAHSKRSVSVGVSLYLPSELWVYVEH